MDIEGIRSWAWGVAKRLIEAGEIKTLERFLLDLRSSNLPHEFANTIVNNITVFKRSGIDVGEIPFELQYFSNVTEFKQIKAIIVATIYNAKVRSDVTREETEKDRKARKGKKEKLDKRKALKIILALMHKFDIKPELIERLWKEVVK